MSDADLPEQQDQAEVFDEDIMGDEGVGPSPDMRVFEELPDVYDVTSRQGDADVDDDLAAADADELEDEDLDELEVDLDEDNLAQIGETPEDDEVFGDDEDDLDDVDGVDDLEEDEVEIETVGDVDGAGDADEAADYESEDELSDEDVQELGYAEPSDTDDEEEEEVDENEDQASGSGLAPGDRGKPAQGHSGEAADLAAGRIHKKDLDDLDVEERQDALLDEGVEETFPASDPVSVKRIT